MALTHDPLEQGPIDDVIITHTSLPIFKMAERFKNLSNLLRDWSKLKHKKEREAERKKEMIRNKILGDSQSKIERD